MKFLTKLSLLFLLTLLLAACSDDDKASKDAEEPKTTESEAPDEEANSEEEPADDPTEEEGTEEQDTPAGGSDEAVKIYEQLEAAFENVESSSSEISMQMDIKAGTEEGTMSFDFETDQLHTTGEHHTTGNMYLDMQGQTMDMDMEVYQTIDATYTKNSMLGEGWVLDGAGFGIPPSTGLDVVQSMQGLASQLQVDEIDGNIVLYLDEQKLESHDFIDGFLAAQSQMGLDSSVDYEVFLNTFMIEVDPSTNLLNYMQFDIEMTGNDPELGETGVALLLEYGVSEYNHLSEITVPQEVIDSAAQSAN
ncbi:DUF6612 family protein [Salirhabdus sp. Marseille-P4669]|uniref:DUF6612 family protein n=1 Tax=Salirhabdus sp. Marseille-P4669 TaxID=2042310 RepID=UPI000C7AD1BD|nr:DUF6612 family protein [Salirhabdus sp. Marseille-P4669]